ncbi:MAG: Hsp33 family molecular chaperone HslO [Steroidobacteraceae bacterium]
MSDGLRRFLFDQHPVRGFWLRLEETWTAALEHQPYGPEVRTLLGQALAAAALLAASLKFEGTLALQIQGDGPVRLLVAQSTHEFGLRAVARLEPDAKVEGLDFRALVGNAALTVTQEGLDRSIAWQGVVPLTGDNLAHSLEAYFATSEQLPTRVVLAAGDRRVGGVLLQKLPASRGAGEAELGREREVWDEAGLLLQTLSPDELLGDDPEQLLPRVFTGHDVRLFESQPIRFECRCSVQRVSSVLRSLGEDEVRSVLAEQGAVTVTCEFCQRPYRFDAVDVEQLFQHDPATPGSDALN